MRIFQVSTPQCGECFSVFDGTINEERKIRWEHPKIDSTCKHEGSFFFQDIEAFTHNVVAFNYNGSEV